MILPDDDSLVLPDTDDGPLVIDSTVPIWDGTQADLLGLLPGAFQGNTPVVDRDAVLRMLGEAGNALWARSSAALESQQSPRFADDVWLDWWGDLLGRRRQTGELTAAYRARLLSVIATITPAAIKGAVDAVVATLTRAKAIYLEPAVDHAFCAPATAADAVIVNSSNDPASSTYSTQSHGVAAAWAAFTQPVAGASTPNMSVYANRSARLLSNYPGASNPNPPSYVTPVTTGGLFWIILPANSGDNTRLAFSSPVVGGFADDSQFVAPATTSDPVIINSNNDPSSGTYAGQSHGVVPTWAYGFCGPASSSLGDLIVSEVDRRLAAGIAYAVIFDPLIASAV